MIDAATLARVLADLMSARSLASLDAVADAPPGAITFALAAFADRFAGDARLLTEAVYGAYYTSAAVQEVIRDLAEAGPRDPSPVFDERLLAQVRASRAGTRRM